MVRAHEDNYLPDDLDELLDLINEATYWNLSVVNDLAEIWGCGKHDHWTPTPSPAGIWEVYAGHGLMVECASHQELMAFLKGAFFVTFQGESKASITRFLKWQKANTIDYVNLRQRVWFEWLFSDNESVRQAIEVESDEDS